jgi:hypothetical protein
MISLLSYVYDIIGGLGGDEAAPNGRLCDTSALCSGRERGGGALLAIQNEAIRRGP